MSYDVRVIDLSVAAANPVQIVAPGKRIAELIALYVPAGASIQLGLGGNPLFTVQAPFTMEPTGEDMQNEGLFYRNPFAQPGFAIEIVIVYGNAGELNTVMP